MLLPLMDKYGPTINWNLTGSLPSGTTFTRTQASPQTTTAIGSDGLLKYFNANEPRFDYDPVSLAPLGLLYEPQRTNVLALSRSISMWTNNAALSVTDNFYTSPDATQNASQIVTDGAFKGRYSGAAVAANTSYAVSGYVKSFSGSHIIRVGAQNAEGGTSNALIHIDTVTGAIADSKPAAYDAYSVLLPNGWTYFKYRILTGAAQTYVSYLAYAIDGGSVFSVWGVQIEAGTIASSLIQTNGSAATRATDQLSFTIPSGVTTLRYTFDDNSTQDVTVSAGAYTVPTNLNRPNIKRIVSV